jgi:DNA excision repair protein ERCC-2
MEFFPHQRARPFQDELMERIFTSDRLLCHVPTGVGKSVSALCGFLADRVEGEKIVVLTRTKGQAAIYFREVSLISRKIKRQILCLQLRSKQEVCPVFGMEAGYEEFIELCKLKQDCPYRQVFRERSGDIAVLAEELKRPENASLPLAQLREKLEGYGCPHMVLMALAAHADIVVASYLYLLNPFLKEIFLGRLGKAMGELLLVLDEAHNLYGMDLLGRSLRRRTVDLAARELDYDFSRIYDVFDGPDDRLDVLELLDPREVGFLLDRGVEVLERGMRKGRKISHTFRTASFFDQVLKMRKDKNWIFFRQDGTLHLKPVLPSEVLEPLKDARKLLLMSGSLSPPEGYASVFGMEDAEVYSLPNIFPRENALYLALKKGLNTSLAKRRRYGDRLWRRYGRAVETIGTRSPKTTMVFVPSYDIMEEVGAHIQCLKEPKGSKELDAFWDAVQRPGKKTVLAVSGGKLSEGVEWGKEGEHHQHGGHRRVALPGP